MMPTLTFISLMSQIPAPSNVWLPFSAPHPLRGGVSGKGGGVNKMPLAFQIYGTYNLVVSEKSVNFAKELNIVEPKTLAI